MQTFIIDWGVGAAGGRFALIQAASLEAACWDADMVGSPFKIAPLTIKKSSDCADHPPRYVEISQPKTPYVGCKIEDAFDWQTSEETFAL